MSTELGRWIIFYRKYNPSSYSIWNWDIKLHRYRAHNNHELYQENVQNRWIIRTKIIIKKSLFQKVTEIERPRRCEESGDYQHVSQDRMKWKPSRIIVGNWIIAILLNVTQKKSYNYKNIIKILQPFKAKHLDFYNIFYIK